MTDSRQQSHSSDVPTSDAEGGASNQPEYGQRVEPEYGELRDALPQGYDPYVYGRPESDEKTQNAEGAQLDQETFAHNGQEPNGNTYNGDPSANQSPYGIWPGAYQGNLRQGQQGQGNANGQNQQQPGHKPKLLNGIDLNDPQQNPMYGHWDSYAIIALVFSFFNIPVLPAIMGASAMWRTRTFHMKGFWIALIAVILNVLTTLVDFYLITHGISTSELTQWLAGQMGSSNSGSSGDSISV